MAKQRDPLRDEAKRLFDEVNGEITNREIAARLGIDEKKVAVWKQRDGWTVVQQKKLIQQKTKAQQKKSNKKVVKAAAKNKTLTEQQITFCLLYTKTYNATQSYMRAFETTYRTAHSYGYSLLQQPEIRAEIKRLQAVKNEALLAGTQDVVELHMRIAFADITEFITFGQTEKLVMGMYGPVKVKGDDGKTVELTELVNDIKFNESVDVDGQLIAEIKIGRDGPSVKLADRQKSLDFLERYFLMNPMDAHKKAYDNARLELDRKKAKVEEFAAKVVPIIDNI